MAKPDWQNQNYKKSNPVQKAAAGALALGGLLAYGAKKAYDKFKDKKETSRDTSRTTGLDISKDIGKAEAKTKKRVQDATPKRSAGMTVEAAMEKPKNQGTSYRGTNNQMKKFDAKPRSKTNMDTAGLRIAKRKPAAKPAGNSSGGSSSKDTKQSFRSSARTGTGGKVEKRVANRIESMKQEIADERALAKKKGRPVNQNKIDRLNKQIEQRSSQLKNMNNPTVKTDNKPKLNDAAKKRVMKVIQKAKDDIAAERALAKKKGRPVNQQKLDRLNNIIKTRQNQIK